MKPLHLLAILATFLLVGTGINSLMRPPQSKEAGPLKKPRIAIGSNKKGELPCTIRRAAFGGTQSALLKVMKGPVVHYVVLDLPTDNPMMPSYQSSWLDANYGDAEPAVIAVFPTVEAAVTRAASLCKRN